LEEMVTTREDHVLVLIEGLSLGGLLRIDVALEGEWSQSVSTVWTPMRGLLGFAGVTTSHPKHIPSIELVFPTHWVGVRCFRRDQGANVFDEALARRLIERVERRLG
jgi:hypothetical protein